MKNYRERINDKVFVETQYFASRNEMPAFGVNLAIRVRDAKYCVSTYHNSL